MLPSRRYLQCNLYSNDSNILLQVDPKTRTTIRNLRIREDTAKYLRNLDLDSAYYDPKTRSMRENPNKGGNQTEQLYSGDNFVRYTGDVKKFGEMQSYAWEAYEKGQEVHLQSAPSQAELLFKDYKYGYICRYNFDMLTIYPDKRGRH